MDESVAPVHRFGRREFLILWGLEIVGLVAIIPYTLTLEGPTLSKLPTATPLGLFLAAQTAQNAILFGIVTATGLLIASRLGLGAPILAGWLWGEPVGARLRAMLPLAIVAGILSGIVVLGLDLLVFAPLLRADLAARGSTLPASINPPAWQGLLAALYGAIDEECLLRLFLLSLIAWIGRRLVGHAERRPTRGVLWAATVLAALAFGTGHLPATAAAGLPLDGLVVTRAIVLNGLAGIVYGWLYWSRGLECAMLAHFFGDLVLHVIAAI